MHIAELPPQVHAAPAGSVAFKERHELDYWQDRKRSEGVLLNGHYEHFYTRHFGIDASFYRDKVILDIGCGPRGSLEWATTAKRRYGVDPLVNDYLMLGAIDHQMRYLCAPSERIPVPDGHCDAVFSFNSLDHVDDVEQTIAEVKRITRVGGVFLLLVEVNHEPTPCEPHRLTTAGLVGALEPDLACVDLRVYVPQGQTGLYDAIRTGRQFGDPMQTAQPGYLSGLFIRR